MSNTNSITKNFLVESTSEVTNTLKRVEDENQHLFKNENESKSSSRSVSKSKCILCVPTISGFDISQAVRLMKPPISNIPIIALTSLPLEEIYDNYIKSGMNDYLTKPLSSNQLENILNKWIS
ncbi:14257_t:CDS:2 [Cetraspora pellucida]|uniref:14257_t:CDS:1 n=1 Tax=Cetraspora pellucida TaxID=1433469 RepID=A0A9N9DUZ8_9GLOM|nr:14257_t:CDS:2 [Cetraspora pellucida]